MKLLATIELDIASGQPLAHSDLVAELKGSWDLFQRGVLREAYATSSPTKVIFVLEAENAAAATTELERLPLVAAGRFRVQVLELLPFRNWSLLFEG